MVHQTSSFDQAGYIFLDFDANYFQSASASANHIASVTFRADQSAFFAGLAACQYLNDNFDSYWTPSHPLSIGTFGGQPIPTVTCYMGGIELAAYVFNTTIENYATQDTPNFPYNNDPSSVAYYKKHQVNIINLGKPTS
jgi:basic membrane lipoprotein Med (substrate-binding protein (PBP1-ABC) superfamily)